MSECICSKNAWMPGCPVHGSVPTDGHDTVWASEEEKRAQFERETRARNFGDPEHELKREDGK